MSRRLQTIDKYLHINRQPIDELVIIYQCNIGRHYYCCVLNIKYWRKTSCKQYFIQRVGFSATFNNISVRFYSWCRSLLFTYDKYMGKSKIMSENIILHVILLVFCLRVGSKHTHSGTIFFFILLYFFVDIYGCKMI